MDGYLPTRYSDAFDSVRFREESKSIDELRIHALMDGLLSILFGQRIYLTENQCIDSVIFLELALRLLEARKRKKDVFIQSPMYYPFALALRKAPPYEHVDFRTMVVKLFSDKNFELSAWGRKLSNDSELRSAMAKLFGEGKYMKALSLMQDQNHQEKLGALETLDEYFDTAPASIARTSMGPEKTLSECLAFILSLEESDLLGFSESSTVNLGGVKIKQTLSQESIHVYIALIRALKRVVKNRVSTQTRSGLYKEEAGGLLDKNELKGLQEVYNTCYNSVNASSIRAENEASSTVFNPGDLWTTAGYELGSLAVSVILHSKKLEGNIGSNNMFLDIKWSRATTGKSTLETFLPMRNCIDLIEILSDRQWRDNINSIQSSFENGQQAVADSLGRHAEWLGKSMSPAIFEVGLQGDKIRFAKSFLEDGIELLLTPWTAGFGGRLIEDLVKKKNKEIIASKLTSALREAARPAIH